MSGQGRDRELNGLEAELASLVPHSGGLNPGFRSLLAREAALTAERGTASAGPGTGDERLCPLCGRRPPHGLKRWAWPGAFSAMSAVAATLLVILIARPAPRIAEVTIAPTPVRAPETKSESPHLGVKPPSDALQGPDDARRPSFGRYAWFPHDPEAWQSLPLPSGPEPDVATVPLSNRELLEQLLRIPVAGGAVDARRGPGPPIPSGARS